MSLKFSHCFSVFYAYIVSTGRSKHINTTGSPTYRVAQPGQTMGYSLSMAHKPFIVAAILLASVFESEPRRGACPIILGDTQLACSYRRISVAFSPSRAPL
jgi:hypothetical protein